MATPPARQTLAATSGQTLATTFAATLGNRLCRHQRARPVKPVRLTGQVAGIQNPAGDDGRLGKKLSPAVNTYLQFNSGDSPVNPPRLSKQPGFNDAEQADRVAGF